MTEGKKGRGGTRRSPATEAAMTAALQAQSMSVVELAAAGGITVRGVQRWLTQMREEHRVYVAEYRPDRRGYPTVQGFRWGDAPDAARTGLTDAEKQRAYRLRLKSKGE